MIALLLATASISSSAIDTERAFARDAQRLGQWTAFRRYAHRDAVMFTPQAVWAQDFLAGRANPPRSMRWSPNESFVSCDGRTAVNTGAWTSGDGKTNGYFTTVWQREKGRWQWVYDGGDTLRVARPSRAQPLLHRASCRGSPRGAPAKIAPPVVWRPHSARPADVGRGLSGDRTLTWIWRVEGKGAREFRTFLWNGARYEQVVYDQTASKH